MRTHIDRAVHSAGGTDGRVVINMYGPVHRPYDERRQKVVVLHVASLRASGDCTKTTTSASASNARRHRLRSGQSCHGDRRPRHYLALKDAASSRKWRMRSSVEGWLNRYPSIEDPEWGSASFLRASASNAGDIPLCSSSAAPLLIVRRPTVSTLLPCTTRSS